MVPQCPKYWVLNQKRVLMALRDAVKHTPCGSRFSRHGRAVQPLGVEYAAEVTGRQRSYMDSAINPNDDAHQLTLADFLLLLQAGLDQSVMDEIERMLGRLSVIMPSEHHSHDDDLMQMVLRCGDSFGHVCMLISVMLEAPTKERQTYNAFVRDVDGLIAQLIEIKDEIGQRVQA